jgi:hypothetical protein
VERGHRHAVGGEGDCVGVGQVVGQVGDGALAGGLMLGKEADEGNHGQAPVPQLLLLVLLQGGGGQQWAGGRHTEVLEAELPGVWVQG